MAREFSLAKFRNIGIMAHTSMPVNNYNRAYLTATRKTTKWWRCITIGWVLRTERGITIAIQWERYRVNITIQHRHVDFTIEVQRFTCVADGAVTVLDSQSGRTPNWNSLASSNRVWCSTVVLPTKWYRCRLLLLSAYHFTTSSSKRSPNPPPIGAGRWFRGIIDLIKMFEIHTNDLGMQIFWRRYSSRHADQATNVPWKLIEAVKRNWRTFDDLNFEGEEITNEEWK